MKAYLEAMALTINKNRSRNIFSYNQFNCSRDQQQPANDVSFKNVL